jgi:hypothetical protein
LLHKDFYGVVEEFWRGCNVTGWMAYILKEKLKGLKVHLRGWNNDTYGDVDAKINKLVNDISLLDITSEESGISVEEVATRKILFSQLWHLKIGKESIIAQRSRMKWLKDGDTNSRFFHACIKSRTKKNCIRALRLGDDWLETPQLIRNATVEYFTHHFTSDHWNRPNLDGIYFPMLTEVENADLIRPFQMDEIEKVVFESDGNKSPGPDGFNFAFVKAMWYLIKGDVRIMLDQFHGIGALPKSFTS